MLSQGTLRAVRATGNAKRGMATLQEVRARMKSVTNISKITKSMKMVAASKLRKVQEPMEVSRLLAEGTQRLASKVEASSDGKRMIAGLFSDRGLCGGINSSIAKVIRSKLEPGSSDTIFTIGDKGRAQLNRLEGRRFVGNINEIGKSGAPLFAEASIVAEQLLAQEFDSMTVVYNQFKSVISYEQVEKVVPSLGAAAEAEFSGYEFDDESKEAVLRSAFEFHLAATLYNSMLEGATSEMSARMTAMDNATRNAGDMIERLTLHYNRTRQAVITRELIEIISGAESLKKAD